ncbi:MAG: exonuclease SbcC [Planctomycetota bacterium]
MKLRRLKIIHLSGVPNLTKLEFGEGINVVIGPNGSGKSSIVTLASECFWPTKAPGRGDAILNWQPDDSSRGAIDFKVEANKNAALTLPEQNFGARRAECYVLKIGDLIESKEAHKGLASQIQKEMAGGLDLDSWKARSRRKIRAGSKERKALANAQGQLRKESQYQQHLADEEKTLERLRQEQADAIRAQREIALLEARTLQLKLEKELTELHAHLSTFPPILKRLTGNELNGIQGLRRELEGKKDALKVVQRERENLEETLENLGLGMGQIPNPLVEVLRRSSEGLRHLNRELENAKRELESARFQYQRMDDRSAPKTEPADQPSSKALRKFSSLMQNAQRNVIEKRVVVDQLENTEHIDEICSIAPLMQARRLLNTWLALPDELATSSGRGPLLLGGASLLVAFGGFNAGRPSWTWAGAAFSLGVLLNHLIAQRHRQHIGQKKLDVVEEFTAAGMKAPIAWSRPPVTQAVEDLDVRLDTARKQRQDAARKNALRNRLMALESESKRHREQAISFARRYGLHLGDDPPLEIVSHLDRLQRLRDAAQLIAKHEGAVSHTKNSIARHVAQAGGAFDQLGIQAADQLDELAGQLGGILEDVEQHHVDLNVLNHKLRHEKSIKDDVEDLKDRVASFFHDIGIEDHHDDAVAALLSQKQEFDEVDKQVATARHKVHALASQLEPHPEIANLSGEQVMTQLSNSRHQSSRLDAIIEELIRIEGDLATAKKNQNLAHAIHQQEQCENDLARVRRDQIDRALQAEIIDIVVEHQLQHTQSKVLSRAVELFSEFTNHEWEMLVDPSEGFKAREVGSNTHRLLSELSTGTRMQLLMAARLAFVETQEDGETLPLFLDEVLSSSDSQRTRLIANSLAKTAARGRQLIYLTVDPQDIKVLKQAAEKEAVPFHLIKLESSASAQNHAQSEEQ